MSAGDSYPDQPAGTEPEEPTAYRWDFDRNPWDSTAATTFSVGVYQWLPKSGGRGLKKSKSIRVMGYTAEPMRVYTKAQDLCDRLNGEQAHADGPPRWLQKQYSVPRPEGMVVERTNDELTGAEVRAVRLQVMKERLLPAGFVKGAGSTYVRQVGDQIHLIDFQSNRWGGDYTVNLGFHYTFIPPFFREEHGTTADFALLDCGLTSRVPHFAVRELDQWYPYGTDRAELGAQLRDNAEAALEVFERFSREWADPTWWLAAWKEGERKLDQRIAPWLLPRNRLFIAAVATHVGDHSLAGELIAHIFAHTESPSARRVCHVLEKAISGQTGS